MSEVPNAGQSRPEADDRAHDGLDRSHPWQPPPDSRSQGPAPTGDPWASSGPEAQGIPADPAEDDLTEPATRPIYLAPGVPQQPEGRHQPAAPHAAPTAAGRPDSSFPASVSPATPAAPRAATNEPVYQPPGEHGADDPLFPAEMPYWQPRIIPSPPPQRGRLLRGLVIGALAGLLVFGTGGFILGRWTGGGTPAAEQTATPGPGAPASGAPASLPPYEQSRVSLNRAKFSGDLAALAEPWLPWMSGCRKSGERDGPQLNPGEAVRVACQFGSIALNFVEYKSIIDRDKTRVRHLAENVEARELTPGVAAGTDHRTTPSGRSEGGYIEYAYRTGEGAAARTVCGLWWDVADKPVAAYLFTFWQEGVGADWEPLRDVWRRHA